MLLFFVTITYVATSEVAFAMTITPTLTVSPNPVPLDQMITFQGSLNSTSTVVSVRITIYGALSCVNTARKRTFGVTAYGVYSFPLSWATFSTYFSSSPAFYSAKTTVMPGPRYSGGASPCVNFQVGVATTTTVACDTLTLMLGASSSCTATVSGATGTIAGDVISWSQDGGTGSVSFLSGNTCALSGTSCSVPVTGSNVGSVTLQASYLGDPNNLPSSGTGDLTVTAAPRIPEYPLSLLPIITLGILAYAAIKRRSAIRKAR